jgi:uncharacterized peroxidase-related enzyme
MAIATYYLRYQQKRRNNARVNGESRDSQTTKEFKFMKNNILLPLTIETAPAGSRPTLEAIQKGFGFIPNLMATFANSPTVLNGYMAMEAAWEKGSFTPVERSVVLLAASVANQCDYCTAAHSTVLKAFLKVPADVVASVRAGKSLADTKLDALVQYTKEIVNERGHVSRNTLDVFLAAGYTKAQAIEVLIGVALKTVSNYVNHFNPATLDAAFQAEAVK